MAWSTGAPGGSKVTTNEPGESQTRLAPARSVACSTSGRAAVAPAGSAPTTTQRTRRSLPPRDGVLCLTPYAGVGWLTSSSASARASSPPSAKRAAASFSSVFWTTSSRGAGRSGRAAWMEGGSSRRILASSAMTCWARNAGVPVRHS